MHFVQLLLYNLAVRLYALGIFFGSLFSNKAKLWLDGRKNWEGGAEKFGEMKGKRIWFHCASLGEFEQARPVLEKYGCQNHGSPIVVSFFSPSGYEVRKNYNCADAVIYLPLDTATNAKRFLDLIKPDVALFAKYEYWYHFLNEMKQRKIPVILFSSLFREKQVFFKWYGGLFRKMLKMFSKIFVQSGHSKKLLSSIGIESEFTFDTRFDRVKDIAHSTVAFPAIDKFKEGSKLFIAGSTWQKDEDLIVTCINNEVMKQYKYVIAPHDINRERIAAMKKQIHVRSRLLSELTEANAAETDVVIVDSIGQLAFLYRYAEMAYVGGGFDAGIHNILEAAVYGIPVLFGSNFRKALEATELIGKKAAFAVSSYREMKQVLARLSDNNSSLYKNASEEAKKYVEERIGGSERVVTEIIKALS